MAKTSSVDKRYELAREQYAAMGVDTEKAMKRLDPKPPPRRRKSK